MKIQSRSTNYIRPLLGRPALLPVLVLLACLALAPLARAVYPPPDGGYVPENTAEGDDALFSNTSGFANTAIGYNALYYNTTGFFNTAIGDIAMELNTTGGRNTALGQVTLFSNTSGNDNTATGQSALSSNTTGNSNTASGSLVLLSNTTGDSNTAVGYNALANNTTGASNIALGESAGINLTTGKNNIDIGNKGVAGEANTIRIGKSGTQTTTVIAGIIGTTVAGGVGVIIGSNGKLGTVVSSARFKEAIQPMDKASEAILALKPVTFRYKKELDPEGIPQFGLVAEEVEKVNPDLVVRDKDGKPYSVRYDQVNAMLLNEFLKEHRKAETQDKKMQQLERIVAEQQATNAEQQTEIQALTATLKDQAAQIQKVSGRLATDETASRMVVNN